jgi:asparagine synthetase B (glutamine-hydrolysing)
MALRELLTGAIQRGLENLPDLPLNLELSGGCDSISLLLCMRDLGLHFEAHTYYFRDNADLTAARQVTQRFGIQHYLYRITENSLRDNEQELRQRGYPMNPTSVDCLIGHLPIVKALQNSIIINGSYADILWGAYGFLARLKHESIPAFLMKREKMLLKPDADGMRSLSRLYAETGNRVIYPYTDKKVVASFMSLPPSMLNDKKALFFEQFGKDIEGISVKRRSQQIASGIRDYRKNNKL